MASRPRVLTSAHARAFDPLHSTAACTHLHDVVMSVPVQPALGLMLVSEHVERTLPTVTQNRVRHAATLPARPRPRKPTGPEPFSCAAVTREPRKLTGPEPFSCIASRAS